MKIRVTKNDITQGKKYSPHYCPVALAVARAKKVGGGSVIVRTVDDQQGKPLIRIKDKEFELPDHALIKVRNYDASLGMSPFQFTLTPLKT